MRRTEDLFELPHGAWRGAASPDTGDGRVFEAWYSDHSAWLRARCRSFVGDDSLAEDVVQETFLRAWKLRDDLARDDPLRGWLWQVARNLCVDAIRARTRMVPSRIPDSPDVTAPEPDAAIVADEDRQQIGKAFASISQRHRELLYRRHVEEVAPEDLAAPFGLTAGGVRAGLFRARHSLREAFRAAEGLGVVAWPALVLRRAFERLRQRAGEAGPAVEVAALALMIATVSQTGTGLHAAVPERTPPSPPDAIVQTVSAAPAGADERSADEDSAYALHPLRSSGSSGEALTASERERATWRARLTVGQRRGDPDSGVSVQLEAPVPQRLDPLLPSLNVEALERRAAEGAEDSETQIDDSKQGAKDSKESATHGPDAGPGTTEPASGESRGAGPDSEGRTGPRPRLLSVETGD